ASGSTAGRNRPTGPRSRAGASAPTTSSSSRSAAFPPRTDLAQRFAGRHRGADGEVEAAGPRPHRNVELGVGDFMHAIGHTGGLPAEQKDVTLAEGKARVGRAGLGRE